MDLFIPKCFNTKNGFQVYRHFFTGYNKLTSESVPFFIEVFLQNYGLHSKKIISSSSLKDDKNSKPCYVLLRVACLGKTPKQILQVYSTDQVSYSRKGFELRLLDNIFTDSQIVGSVSVINTNSIINGFYSDCGVVKWNLRVNKTIKSTLKNATKWYVGGIKSYFEGKLTWDNKEYLVIPEKSFGYIDSFWGNQLINPLVNVFTTNLVTQITGKRLQKSVLAANGFLGKSKTKKIIIIFNYENTEYIYNKSFITKDKVTYNYSEDESFYHFSITAQNKKSLLDIDLFLPKDQILPMKYENPQGLNNNKNNFSFVIGSNCHGEIRLYKKVGKSLEIVEHARVENGYGLKGGY